MRVDRLKEGLRRIAGQVFNLDRKKGAITVHPLLRNRDPQQRSVPGPFVVQRDAIEKYGLTPMARIVGSHDTALTSAVETATGGRCIVAKKSVSMDLLSAFYL